MMMTVVEVQAVLSECREEDDSCATLARLKMAIEYEEKKVSNETKSMSTLQNHNFELFAFATIVLVTRKEGPTITVRNSKNTSMPNRKITHLTSNL